MIYYEAARGEDLLPEMCEIFRYLGYGNTLPDEPTQKLTEQVIKEMQKSCTPKASFGIEKEIAWTKSRDLAKALENCESVLVFCATLGTGADRILQKYAETAPSKAAIAQAAGAAMIENWCDKLCGKIENTLQKDGLYLRPRFSPGYGDFPIEQQKILLERVDATRRIGVSLTDSFMMTPTKSVSAVAGITREKPDCLKHSCTSCKKNDCPFRRPE